MSRRTNRVRCIIKSAGCGAIVTLVMVATLPVVLVITVLGAIIGGLFSAAYTRPVGYAVKPDTGDVGSKEKIPEDNDEVKE